MPIAALFLWWCGFVGMLRAEDRPQMPAVREPVMFNTPEADRIMTALQVFPGNNPWNKDISTLPVLSNSKEIVARVGANKPIAYNLDMAFVIVPKDQKRVAVRIRTYPAESDKGPFPIPDNAPIENWPLDSRTLEEAQGGQEDADRHLLVLDPLNRKLYEMWQARKTSAGWECSSAAVFDLGSNTLRPEGWTSADAAGLPVLPAVIRYDEVERGIVAHAMRFTVRNTSRAYVHPATHFASAKTDPNLPRMGERFRLRADFDVSGFSPHVQAILKGLKTFGMLVADNGGDWRLSVAPDSRIKGLDELRRLKGSDFEVVATENAPNTAVGNRSEITYAGDDTIFGNPERGWFVFGELKPHGNNINSWANDELLKSYREKGYRLAKHILIIPTRSGPIPHNFLEDLQREADLMRKYGFKVIYRFTYNWNHDINNDDAPVVVTLAHLKQLRSFFTENTDVLFAMEMGFIGYWGEMHSSTQGHTVSKTVGLSESGQRILHKALEVFPQDRFVAARYPQVIYRDSEYYGSLGYKKPLATASAYNGSEQSRLAAWYANFGAGEILYHRDAELLSKWAPETRYVPMWAHCDHFEDVTMDPREWLETARAFHYVALSNPKDESSTRDIYDRWINDGACDTFSKKLGYRFRLVRAELPKTLRPGSACEVKIEMANDGFARVTNPRNVELILRGPATYTFRHDDECGNRLWLPGPGETKTLSFNAGLSDEMLPGDYEVLLNLPDPQPSLARRPDYSIRLANEKVWEAESGFNRLLHTIQIDPNADGQPKQKSKKHP